MELEDKPDLVPSELCQLSITHSSDILTVHQGTTRTWLVQGPDYVEESRLAGPRGPHYHHELTLQEFQRNSAECIYRDPSQLVALLEIL